MKILLWAPLGAGSHYWGPGTSAYGLFKHWAAKHGGVTVDLAHGYPEQENDGTFAGAHFISSLRPFSVLALALYLWRSRRWLKANAHRYDVFYGLSLFEYTVSPAVWANQAGVATVVKSIGLGGGLSPVRGVKGMLKLAEKRRKKVKVIDKLVSISGEITAELASYGIPSSQIEEIPNAVDTAHFVPVDEETKSVWRKAHGLKDCTTVLFLGGLSARKAPHLIARAVHKLRSQGWSIQCLFVGPVRDRSYREMLDAEGLWNSPENGMHWTDHIQEVTPYIQASDIFVLPSASEGLSNAMLEAMACGAVPVVTRVSGATDVVRDGENGIFIERSEAAIAAALATLHRERDLRIRLSVAARQTIVEGYSYDVTIKRYDHLFRSYLKKADCARET